MASMLEMLKEKVDRRPVRRMSTKPSEADAAASMEVESLKLELKLKTADASFLEQEVARKDAMLGQMIRGRVDDLSLLAKITYCMLRRSGGGGEES